MWKLKKHVETESSNIGDNELDIQHAMQIETKMKLIENVKNSEFSLDVSLQTLGSTGKKVVKLKIYMNCQK